METFGKDTFHSTEVLKGTSCVPVICSPVAHGTG